MISMHVPKPVMSLSIQNQDKKLDSQFAKALSRFQREDPTFQVSFDQEAKETIISGMGELHLFIYTERLKREYGIPVVTGKPQVAFRETIESRAHFAYLHRKQTGGAGQYAKICGYIESISEDSSAPNEFVNDVIGGTIPPEYMPACKKGFEDATEKGYLAGYPITGVRMVINDGAFHSVDSSDLAFRLCTVYAFKEAFMRAKPYFLEPIMNVEITSPSEYQTPVLAGVSRRKGIITTTELKSDIVTINAEVSLKNMFGYSTDLRSVTQGKGEFSMEYFCHSPVPRELSQTIIDEANAKAEAKL